MHSKLAKVFKKKCVGSELFFLELKFRELLNLELALPKAPALSAKDRILKITGIDLNRCPCCGEGTMIFVGDLPALRHLPRRDSS